MRRASREPDALDRFAAPAARFARSAISQELILILALQAGTADVIADAGDTLLDGPRQHGLDGVAPRASLSGRGFRAELRGVQPGREQRFVRVDVTDAGHDGLIEQHRFQAAL